MSKLQIYSLIKDINEDFTAPEITFPDITNVFENSPMILQIYTM